MEDFKLGKLTEDDFDGDYAPGRADSTMSDAHKASLARMARETRAKAANVKKSEGIVIVLKPA